MISVEDSEALEAELKRRKDANPSKYVKFNRAVRLYADAWADFKKTIILFPAANGIGKTVGTVTLLSWSLWPEDSPGWFRIPMQYKMQNLPKTFRIVSTTEEAGQGGTIQKAIKELWPKGRYETSKNRKPFDCWFKTDTGWEGDVMTYDQAPQEFEGPSKGIIVYNEPPSREIRKACVFRTRMGGFECFPMTPLYDAAWIKDDLIDRWPKDDKIAVITGDVEDACKEHGVNGHLSHKRITELIEEMDEGEKEARAHGKFMHLSGVILKDFSRDVHVPRENLVPPLYGVDHYMVVDPHIGKPIFALWAYVDMEKNIFIYDEYPDYPFEGAKDSNLNVREYSEIFKGREKRTIQNRIMDRHFGSVRRTLGGLTLKQEFAEQGLYFTDSYTMEPQAEIEVGILKIKDYLAYNKGKPISNLNRPKLTVSPKCQNLILALERWSRDASTGKPREQYKDPVDCLRYLVMANPEIDLPKTWTEGELAYYGVGT